MTPRFLILTTLAAALGACSSVPPRNAALEQARTHYNGLQADAQVAQYAGDEARRASAALQRADRAQAEGATATDIDHLAYLADQRTTIAREAAAGRAAQAQLASAGTERDRMRLAQRTQEADNAQRQLATAEQGSARKSAELAQAEQDNARKSAELAAAGRTAQADQARLASRDARVDNLESQLKDLNARRTERGIVVTLGDLLFDTGAARLQSDGTRSMARLADFMNRNPQRRASIEGYTDSVGSESSNQALSDRRAHAVMAALVDLGVKADRLDASGHGEAQPVAGNDTAAGRQRNRRVEVVFTAEAGDILAK